MKVGDTVTFNSDKVQDFIADCSNSTAAEVQKYKDLVLAGIDQIGTIKEIGYALTTVSFADGWDLPIPNKYLIQLP